MVTGAPSGTGRELATQLGPRVASRGELRWCSQAGCSGRPWRCCRWSVGRCCVAEPPDRPLRSALAERPPARPGPESSRRPRGSGVENQPAGSQRSGCGEPWWAQLWLISTGATYSIPGGRPTPASTVPPAGGRPRGCSCWPCGCCGDRGAAGLSPLTRRSPPRPPFRLSPGHRSFSPSYCWGLLSRIAKAPPLPRRCSRQPRAGRFPFSPCSDMA